MIDRDEAERVLMSGGRLYLCDGTDAGPIRQILVDEYSGRPSFCTVRPYPSNSTGSGPAGRETLVAIHQATTVETGIRVPYGAETIDNAPQVLDGHDLTVTEEDALFEYYDQPVSLDPSSGWGM